MEQFIRFLEQLGVHRWELLFLMLEAMAALWLLIAFSRFYIKQKHFRRYRDGWLIETKQAAFQDGLEMQCVFRCYDRLPVYVSDGFERVFRVTVQQLRGDVRYFLDRLQGNMGEQLWNRYLSWNGEEICTMEVRLTELEAWYRVFITRSQDQKYDRFWFQDITEDRARLKKLKEKVGQAEEESQSKTAFLSNMSHEIRTPMNGILGMLMLARTQIQNTGAMTYIDKAEELSKYLLSVINDILDMSRIEADKLQLEEKPFGIHELAKRLQDMFQKNIESKGLKFILEIKDFTVEYLVGDEFRILQVLVNFLSNALKFTSEGEVRLTFRQILRENEKISFMVQVHDTGIGMEASFINRIFRPFEQESAGVAKKYGGSGLGMAIADQMVSLMGGEIVIDSMPGKGSDFTVYLSLPEAQMAEAVQTEAAAPEESEFTYEGCHILMAEDNAINIEIAVSILEMKGATVDVAENGKEAVEKFAASEPGTYDFILMDVQMPVMDGREAAMEIRRLPREDADKILIFALSADAFVEAQRYSIQCGMDGHFSKPIDFDEMGKEIGRIQKEKTRESLSSLRGGGRMGNV